MFLVLFSIVCIHYFISTILKFLARKFSKMSIVAAKGFETNIDNMILALAQVVSRVEDVNFDDGSVYNKICLLRKKKGNRKDLLTLKRMWIGNEGNIQNKLKTLLERKVNVSVQPESTSACITHSAPEKSTNLKTEINESKDVASVGILHSSSFESTRSSNVSFKNVTTTEEDVNFPPQIPSATLKRFSRDDGRYSIKSTLLINNKNKVDGGKFRHEIEKLMVNTLRYYCVLSFYSFRNNKLSSVIYGKCRYTSCPKHFRFEAIDTELLLATIFIRSNNAELHHIGKPVFKTLRGSERHNVKTTLKSKTPRLYQMEVNADIDLEIAERGNFQDARSLAVLQKCRSEQKCEQDQHLRSQDLSDLFEKHINDMVTKDPYIRNTGLPLYAYMFKEETLNVIDNSDVIGYFDASGQMVRRPKNIPCKRIMYYPLIINKNSTLVPIAEMVTAEHDISSISAFLKKYRTFVVSKTNHWPILKCIVVDWSWALIHSLMWEWNNMDITKYLTVIYAYLVRNESLNKDFIVIHTCCAHFQKRVSYKLREKFAKYKSVISLILDCTALIIHCTRIAEIDDVFKHMVMLLLTKTKTKSALAVNYLFKRFEKINQREIDEDMIPDHISDDNIDTFWRQKFSRKISEESPFFKRYYSILNAIKNSVEKTKHTTIESEFYCPEMAHYITKRYMPFVPMWSALLLHRVKSDITRLSNANVENFFRKVKEDIFKDEQREVAIGRFVNQMCQYNKNACSDIRFKEICKSKKTNDSKQKISRRKLESLDSDEPSTKKVKTTELSKQNPNNPFIKEEWQKKRKMAYSHFEGLSIGRFKAKLDPDARKREVQIKKSKKERTSSAIEGFQGIPILRNGSDPSLEAITINNKIYCIKNTCAFDSIFQLLLSSAVNSMTVKSTIEAHKDSNQMCQLICDAYDNCSLYSIYKKRAEILVNIHLPSRSVEKNYVVNCETNVVVLMTHLFPNLPSVTEQAICSIARCKEQMRNLRSFGVSCDVLTGDEFRDVITNHISIRGTRKCSISGCTGLRTYTICETGPFCFIEVTNPDGTEAKITLTEIPKTFKDPISHRNYELLGLIDYKPGRSSRSSEEFNIMGHYTAICKIKNMWVEYNDLSTREKKICESFVANPSILVYAK